MKNKIFAGLLCFLVVVILVAGVVIASLKRDLAISCLNNITLSENISGLVGTNASLSRLMKEIEAENIGLQELLATKPDVVEHTVFVTKPVTVTIPLKDRVFEDLLVKGIVGRKFVEITHKPHEYSVVRTEKGSSVFYAITDNSFLAYSKEFSGEEEEYYKEMSAVTVLKVRRAKKWAPWRELSLNLILGYGDKDGAGFGIGAGYSAFSVGVICRRDIFYYGALDILDLIGIAY